MAALPRDLLAAIGDVTVNWTYVLIQVEIAIWGMLSLTPRQGTALTNPFKYPGRMDIFASVGTNFFKDKPELDEFKAIVKKIHATYAERNKIEHSIWQHYFGENDPSIRVKVLNDSSVKPEFITAREVEKTVQDIIALVMEIDAFQKKHIPPPRT